MYLYILVVCSILSRKTYILYHLPNLTCARAFRFVSVMLFFYHTHLKLVVFDYHVYTWVLSLAEILVIQMA